LRNWFLEELMIVVRSSGEYKECLERYTADCTKGAIVKKRMCPGKAVHTEELCLAGGSGCAMLAETVEEGQGYDLTLTGHKEVVLTTGTTVVVKVIDAKDDDAGSFNLIIDAAPEAGVIWAMLLVVAVSLAS